MAWQADCQQRRRAVHRRAGLHHRDCRCHHGELVSQPAPGGCRAFRPQGGRQESQGGRGLRAVANRLDAEGIRSAARLPGPDGVHQDAQEHPVVQVHLGVLAGDGPLIPVGLAAAEVAQFC